MTIPNYQTMMLPLLEFIKDGAEYSVKNVKNYIISHFKITEAEQKELIPSGKMSYVSSRVGWAKTYLKKAGLLDSPQRAYIQITQRGLNALKGKPSQIDINYLKKFPEFFEFISFNSKTTVSNINERANPQTPEESFEESYVYLRRNLEQEILEQIKKVSPQFFEQLVVDVLLAIGYGGSHAEAGKAIGQSGDGGIDGIIYQDKLGLDIVYIQAKRWEGNVGSKEIRNFVGSLVGKKANKGVFITTSNYTNDALNYVKEVHHKVILIHGERLVELMMDYNVGVIKDRSYEIKKIDHDYFEE